MEHVASGTASFSVVLTELRQNFSSFHGLWLNFLHSLSSSSSQMSHLAPPRHKFLGKKDVKKHVSYLAGFFFLLQCCNSVDKYWGKPASAPIFSPSARTGPVLIPWCSADFVNRYSQCFCALLWPTPFYTHFSSKPLKVSQKLHLLLCCWQPLHGQSHLNSRFLGNASYSQIQLPNAVCFINCEKLSWSFAQICLVLKLWNWFE